VQTRLQLLWLEKKLRQLQCPTDRSVLAAGPAQPGLWKRTNPWNYRSPWQELLTDVTEESTEDSMEYMQGIDHEMVASQLIGYTILGVVAYLLNKVWADAPSQYCCVASGQMAGWLRANLCEWIDELGTTS
jgi:hypothetical protein